MSSVSRDEVIVVLVGLYGRCSSAIGVRFLSPYCAKACSEARTLSSKVGRKLDVLFAAFPSIDLVSRESALPD